MPKSSNGAKSIPAPGFFHCSLRRRRPAPGRAPRDRRQRSCRRPTIRFPLHSHSQAFDCLKSISAPAFPLLAAFDVAGLRAAALLATAASVPADAQQFASLSDTLYTKYLSSNYTFNPKFSYFYYCTLWPARLFPLNSGPVSVGFRNVGPQMPDTWLYFPLATAHQGLLAGSRQLGFQTIDAFLAYPKMTVRVV